MIGLMELVKTVLKISTPTELFPSTASSVPTDTSRTEKDPILVSSCQYQVQALPHYAILIL